jgi:hypothetical protein
MKSGIELLKESETAIVELLHLDQTTRQRIKPAIRQGLWTVIEMLEKVEQLGECGNEEVAKAIGKSVIWTQSALSLLTKMPTGLKYKLRGGHAGKPKMIYYIDKTT